MADPIFVVITESGKVWRKPTETGYFGVLRDVYTELQSAGSVWDRPSKLLMNGEMVVSSKLTGQQVIEARARVAAGEPCYRIAAEFGVHKGSIARAVSGKTWSHVK